METGRSAREFTESRPTYFTMKQLRPREAYHTREALSRVPSACGTVLDRVPPSPALVTVGPCESDTWDDACFRVTDRAGQVVVYELDRWD